MPRHEIHIEPRRFQPIADGSKAFLVMATDKVKLGDMFDFVEQIPGGLHAGNAGLVEHKTYTTGRSIQAIVKHVERVYCGAPGLMVGGGHAVLGFKLTGKVDQPQIHGSAVCQAPEEQALSNVLPSVLEGMVKDVAKLQAEIRLIKATHEKCVKRDRQRIDDLVRLLRAKATEANERTVSEFLLWVFRKGAE